MTHWIPKKIFKVQEAFLLHCLLMNTSLLLNLWLGSFHYGRVFYTRTTSGWNITSVDLSLSPVAQSCQLFKRAKQHQSGAGKQFMPKLLIYTPYSLLSILCIWATKSCFRSSCSFVSISVSLGRLHRRTGSSLRKDKSKGRVMVKVEKSQSATA